MTNGSAVACSPVSPTSPRRSLSGPNTGTPTRSRSYGKPPRNRSSPKSDADVKPSTGLKLRRTPRPPGSHLGGPGLRRRHGELVALDDVREPFGLRHWDFIAVRELDDLRHFCFAALGQADYRPKELFESGR